MCVYNRPHPQHATHVSRYLEGGARLSVLGKRSSSWSRCFYSSLRRLAALNKAFTLILSIRNAKRQLDTSRAWAGRRAEQR